MQRASHRSSERAFDDWCAKVTAEVMEAVHAESLERARAFEAETGSRVSIEYPSREAPRQEVFPDDKQLSFMKFCLGDATVYFYSARSPNKLPSLHLVSATEQLRPSAEGGDKPATMPMRQRMVSGAVARITEHKTKGYLLCHPDSKQECQATELVYLAFERLVKEWRRLPAQ